MTDNLREFLPIAGSHRDNLSAYLKTIFKNKEDVKAFVSNSGFALSIEGSMQYGGRDFTVGELINSCESARVLPYLLARLLAENPNHKEIVELVSTLSKEPLWKDDLTVFLIDKKRKGTHTLTKPSLEALTSDCNPFLNAKKTRDLLDNALNRVCIIQRKHDNNSATHLGTGFLIGEDLILTCYHVPEEGNGMNATPLPLDLEGLQAVFDYHDNYAKRITIDILNKEVAKSPWAACDKNRDLSGSDTLDKLDFVILKLKDASDVKDRKYFKLSEAWQSPERASPIIIAQHPKGDNRSLQPLQITVATPGWIGLYENATRIKYYNGTLPGSSGSPVFDGEGNLIGIHHAEGRRKHSGTYQVEYNQGVPIHKIAELIKRGGFNQANLTDNSEVQNHVPLTDSTEKKEKANLESAKARTSVQTEKTTTESNIAAQNEGASQMSAGFDHIEEMRKLTYGQLLIISNKLSVPAHIIPVGTDLDTIISPIFAYAKTHNKLVKLQEFIEHERRLL